VASKGPSLLAEIERDVLGTVPLADVLRKCVVFGGRAGSIELRDWATRELRGYDGTDGVPDYRTVAAPIMVEAVTAVAHVNNQRIAPSALPDFVQEHIKEEFQFRQGVGELEALVQHTGADDSGGVKLSLPMAAEIGRVMDQESSDPYQHILSIYWSVSRAAIVGVLDHVRNSLAELVGEIRAGMPDDEGIPPASLVSQAVNVAIHGSKARVVVSAAQSQDEGISSVVGNDAVPEPVFWTRSRRIGAFVAGTASVLGLAVALMQWLR
jgi:hypothetical protein